MKFSSKKVDHSVNRPVENPIHEWFKLLFYLFLFLLVLYFSLGFFIDMAVSHVPIEMEQRFFNKMSSKFKYDRSSSQSDDEVIVQKLLDNLVLARGEKSSRYKVHIAETDDFNALALPGGNIVIFRGLLEKIGSENELSMVLGHELGHIENRDSLRQMGRGLLLSLLCGFLFGDSSKIQTFVEGQLLTMQSLHSQKQELMADAYGLDCLNHYYGHVGGAFDFYNELLKNHGDTWFQKIDFHKSHPLNQERIDFLKGLIKEKGYTEGEKKEIAFVEKLPVEEDKPDKLDSKGKSLKT